ncbi:ribosome silencing factor [Paeniroseomonas aquatica]|uniref:Ribosomal silencing factor RsfS n=1 Tax=Paeniroseomonas aquatica TaxID=373043 RepID=A0ABT8A113_9PROT|nr:ribosome silencing factor [Paeniroseomonas aquatica]MDN3563173.1 ribosome silencing factor [Paeniroseomonas aquatica]
MVSKAQAVAGPDVAKPAKGSRAKPKVTPDRLEQLVNAARTSLEDDKAEDIVVLDVTDRASYADRLVIATGFVDRQIQAMANHLEDALEKVGMKLRRDAIQASDDWVLIDCGDMIIHLFKAEARALYALERMWGPESPQGDEDGATLMDGDQLPE